MSQSYFPTHKNIDVIMTQTMHHLIPVTSVGAKNNFGRHRIPKSAIIISQILTNNKSNRAKMGWKFTISHFWDFFYKNFPPIYSIYQYIKDLHNSGQDYGI